VGKQVVTYGSHNELRARARDRPVRVEGDEEMRGMVTKRKDACKTSVSVKINGILKFLGQSKFGRLTAFGTFKSCGGGYRVSHCRTLKVSSKQSFCLVTLTEIASVSITNRNVRIQNFKVWTY
jgi:hypothetical protein